MGNCKKKYIILQTHTMLLHADRKQHLPVRQLVGYDDLVQFPRIFQLGKTDSKSFNTLKTLVCDVYVT